MLDAHPIFYRPLRLIQPVLFLPPRHPIGQTSMPTLWLRGARAEKRQVQRATGNAPIRQARNLPHISEY
jgi:hypothetical protein